MGWTASQIAQTTLWHFIAALEGHGRANGWWKSGKDELLSEERLAELGIDGF